MKKTLKSLLGLTALFGLFTFTSCQKEHVGNGTQFRATMEGCTDQHGKTTLNGTALNWVSGDQIAIYGTAGAGVYSATPLTPATVAVFDNVSGETGDGPFRAFYPSTLTTDGVNITLPVTQTYVEGSINEFPMYAESTDNPLAFKNLRGVLKLHLTKAGVNTSSTTVTAATATNGTWSVDYNGGDPELDYSANGTNATTLTCATPQSIAEGKDFYIYLPEGSYSGLQIEMTAADGRYCVKTANTTISVSRSQYTLISLGETLEFRPIGSKGGLFTINADGDQVWFSQGNLQYQASTGTWRFAENQYDYVGDANSNISTTYSGWIDLFGWGTGSNPTLSTTTINDYQTFVDWGNNSISNGGNTANCGWRTLSWTEWDYVFNTRETNTNLGTANARYAKSKVNNVQGVILFPDGYTHPTGITTPTGINVSRSTGWNTNNYTIAQWAEMEAAGAVFLPAAGYRWSTNVENVGSHGYYWSHSGIGAMFAYYVHFYTFGLSSSNEFGRHLGSSVRPVQDND